MNFLKSLYNKIKAEPDIWFFYGFLLTFTLSVRKVLFYFPIKGIFNEYSGIYIYVSDIFLCLSLFFYSLYLLRNKYTNMSSIKLWISKFFHNLYLFIPFILVIWSFISISWSQNQTLAFFGSLKLLEMYLLYIYVISRIVPRGTILIIKKNQESLECSTWNNFLLIIIGLGFIQAIIGIAQFISQKSLGLFFLKESLITPDIPGVAKIILDGHKYIRAYGLFPHPNILGGFLMISIILTFLLLKMFHVEHSKITGNKEKFLKMMLSVQALGLILTFSKSAILGLFVGLIYMYWKLNVPRGTLRAKSGWNKLSSILLNIKKLFHVEHFRVILFGFALILIILITILKPDLNSIFLQSLKERYLYLNVSRRTILENPFWGVGMGQFVTVMQKYSPATLQIWQYQPVHNLFILIWAELGLIGLVLFLWILKLMLFGNRSVSFSDQLINKEYVPRGTIYLRATLWSLIFIFFFDHYLWTIQQGELFLWVVLASVAGMIEIEAEEEKRIAT